MLFFRSAEVGLLMSFDEIAIKVEGVEKHYEIYENPQDRLKQGTVAPLWRLIGRENKRYYKSYTALNDISFDVKKGETLGIIGQNGAGKSTLLQIICGTLNPSHGQVSTKGRIAALLELGSGFNPEFTGRENVFLNAMILGLSKEETTLKFDDIAAFADIGDFIDQPVKTYSSGMTLRLAFAVIAHVDADILIVDEALSVGDAFFTQKCMRFLRKFMKTGTVLFVSHDTSAIVNLCDTAILLKSGRIFQSGKPKDVIKTYLEMSYDASDNVLGISPEVPSEVNHKEAEKFEDYVDFRREYINNSNLRNDIEIFSFDPNSDGFGDGDVTITSAKLLTENGDPAIWLVGGENVSLEIVCEAVKAIERPIVGFTLKGHIGQALFADNTFVTYEHKPMRLEAGEFLTTKFDFRLPILPSGDYSFAIAIADGTQEKHVQHHWLHEALIIKVHSSSVVLGIIGVPMANIEMKITK